MKKITSILLILLMGISLAACTGNSNPAETITPDSESVMKEISVPENRSDTSEADTEGEESIETEESEDENNMNEVKILVAYFSATNTTGTLAKYVADGLDADLYEIVPEEPYRNEDLNYSDDNSRTTIEMNDPSARPAILGSVLNMDQYDIVFIGYPIWWGEAPRIVSTFMESYNFSGKTIVPFCTSGSSGMGSSATNLQKLTDEEGTEWLAGQRFSGGNSRDEMLEWVNSLGLDVTGE